MFHYYHLKLIIVLAVLLLAACSNEPAQSPNAYPGPSSLSAYPGPNSLAPYPAPQELPGIDGTAIPIWPTNPPPPESGKASISGTVFSYTINRLVPGTLFYLTPAAGSDHRSVPAIIIGPDEGKGDIRGTTDGKGQFVLNKVPPGNYYLVLWAPYDWVLAENSKEDNSPRLFELAANEKQQLGMVYAPWP